MKETARLHRRTSQLERQVDILRLIQARGFVSSSDLGAQFGASPNTVRRDLRQLEEQGLLKVTRGGALPVSGAPMGMPLGQREDEGTEEKIRIGERACEYVSPGQAIILDAGTTTVRMTGCLRELTGLTVITNGLNVARALSGSAGVTTLLCGGILNDVTGSLAGFHAEEFMRQFHVATTFLSAGGVTADGVANTNVFEVRVKRSMLEAADRVILLVTHDKIGRQSFAPFARLDEIDLVLTDTGADPGEVAKLRDAGAEVILC